MSLKNERDSTIRGLLRKHNIGSLPSGPFSDEVASNLTDRIQSKLKDLHKDLQEKKVHFHFLNQHYFVLAVFSRWKIAWYTPANCNTLILPGFYVLRHHLS